MPPSQGEQTLNDSAVENAFKYLRSHLPSQLAEPKIAIISGSGLGSLVNIIEEKEVKKIEFSYKDIPGFVTTTVQGHAGKLVFGLLDKTPVVCMLGRFHFYEGHTQRQITLPIRVFYLLGVKSLIVTNASGSLNQDFKAGDVAVLSDHISLPGLAGMNPLIGSNFSGFPRFPAMSNVYDFELRKIAFKAAHLLNLALREGVYCFVAGPSYETRAEARFLRSIGGDIVGMSTIPEVIVARHCGIKVLGLSLVTNMVLMSRPQSADPAVDSKLDVDEVHLSHEGVLEVGRARAQQMQSLIRDIVKMIN